MTDETSTDRTDTEVDANLTVSVTFSVEDLLRAGVGRHYDYDSDPEEWSGALSQELIERAARRLADSHRTTVKDEIGAVVQEVVGAQVRALLASDDLILGARKTGTLREFVVDAAREWPTAKARDTYGSGPTNLQKLVADEVSRAFQGEVKQIVDAAKAELRATLQAKAGEMILQAAADLNRTVTGR